MIDDVFILFCIIIHSAGPVLRGLVCQWISNCPQPVKVLSCFPKQLRCKCDVSCDVILVFAVLFSRGCFQAGERALPREHCTCGQEIIVVAVYTVRLLKPGNSEEGYPIATFFENRRLSNFFFRKRSNNMHKFEGCSLRGQVSSNGFNIFTGLQS